MTSLTTKTISTQSKLTFQPRWTQHGKNLTCQLWDRKAEQMLSKATVLLDVKRECPPGPQGKDEGLVSSPPPQSVPRVAGTNTEGRVMGPWTSMAGKGPARAMSLHHPCS